MQVRSVVFMKVSHIPIRRYELWRAGPESFREVATSNAEGDTSRGISQMLVEPLRVHFPSHHPDEDCSDEDCSHEECSMTGSLLWFKASNKEGLTSLGNEALCNVLEAAFKSAYNLDVGVKCAKKYVDMLASNIMSSTALARMQADPELVATAVLPPLAWVVSIGAQQVVTGTLNM